jgi:dephospho-CoA kinase
MLVIGLVGATGAGKTQVLRILESLGAHTVAADELSRQVLAPNAPALSSVREAFGDAYFDAEGNLIRKALGNLIFSDETARRRLDAIVHPMMTDLLRQKLEQWRHEGVAVAVVESAVLEEMGALSLVDVLVRVDAPRNVRAARLQARDNLTAAEAEARLQAHERLALDAPATEYAIINDDNDESLRRRVEQLWRTLVRDC